MIYQRGDIVKVNLNPVSGHEQGNYRPVLVLNRGPLFGGVSLVVPITSNPTPKPFAVSIPNGLKTTGTVLCFQMRTIDLDSRGAKLIEKAPDALVDECAKIAAKVII